MIQVQLQAKHFYFIVNDLKNVAAYEFFHLISSIRTATAGVETDEDMVSVDTSVDALVRIFIMLSQKKEGEVNNINTEMSGLLMQQIGAGMAAQDPEWMEAAQRITQIRETNWAVTDNAILEGKAFLLQQ